MRRTALTIALFLGPSISFGDDKPAPSNDGAPKYVTEHVRAQWRKPGSQRIRLTGKVTVIDANTLEFGDGTRIQAAGATDAPDLEQMGVINGRFYPCGKEAAEFVGKLIGDRPVSFYAFGDRLERDAGNRLRGSCYIGDVGLDAELVRNGWALAHHSGLTAYEVFARENKRGLWRGEFVLPELWRTGQHLPGETTESEEAVLAQFKEEKPAVYRDDTKPGRPVVRIVFLPNSNKKVTEAGLGQLKNLPNLRSVDLGSQGVTDGGLKHLATLRQLEELNINWSKVSPAAVLALVQDRSNMRRLEIGGVPFRDEDLAKLKNLTELRTLSLRGTLVTDKGMEHLKPFGKLQRLSLMSTSVGDAGLERLAGLTNLEDLDLDRTKITDAGLAKIKNLRNLRRLQFAHTAITDPGLEHLENLSSLKTLNTNGTKITKDGLDRLRKRLPQLDGGTPKERQGHESGPLKKIASKVEVVNAHMLRFEDGAEIEMNGGMDAPELEQKGVIGDSVYPCGKEAAEFLKKLIGDQSVTFYEEGRRGDKLWGDCFVGETCLQIEMVRNGWAVSHHTGMDSWQAIAAENKRGLWQGRFVLPELWRRGERLPGE
jgi:endonuclease YncB( thermonuclease family)